MDLHHHQQPYAQSDGHSQAYDPSHSYEAYYGSYPQPQYESPAYSHQYYDYSTSYQQPPPPGVDPTHHHYVPAPLNEGMEVAAFPHSSEYAVPMGATMGNGGAAQGGGGSRGSFRGRGGRRGVRGGFGRGNFRGRGRGRGGGRGQEPAQPPPPKPARQPKPHAWCDICRVDCNSLEILEQHKAGKRHKRTVQRIQEYEAQQKQLAGYQSTIVVSPTTTETGPSVAESVPQTSPAPVAASGTAVASEAGTSNPPAKVEIPEEHNKETGAQNQPVTEGPSESVKAEASGTQALPPSDTTQAEAASSGKRPFIKRPRPDGYGLGFVYGYGGGRVDRGGRRGGRFDRGGKRPRRFGEFQPWPPMPMPMPMMPPMPMPGPASHLPRVRPIVCTLCNVSCDTPAVFDTHVSGKKHQTRISKLQGPNTVFGPITVFIPPGQPTPYPQNGPEPVFYGLTTPELIKQHEMLMRDQMEDEDEEEEDAGEDDQQDENPDERAEGDGQDEAMINNGTNGISEQSKEQNESVVEPTPGTVDSTAVDENQDSKVAPSNNDAVPGLQTTAGVSEEVVVEK
ncbi:Zinc-finger of C2H2 type [Carex littledalei]|uniref:Zinc-finger of C2H2 type n=1 Tax=Carex littledalei TaxID=544730 RepID=A0A833UZR4_9POAL|nr:Zinc-finger of C2H2 type [Carex littledalei]